MTSKTTTKEPEGVVGGDIHKRIVAIMREIPAITKDRKNTQQGYSFRGIDDVYNLVHPIMAKHGVFMTCEVLEDKQSERPSKGGGILITRSARLRYRFVAEDGSSITTEVIGEGMDSGDKAANKALSVGQKYAVLQTFMIPTDEPKDPEVDNPEPVAAKGREPGEDEDDFFETPPPTGKFHLLDKFSAAKKQLGEESYYEVLASFGVDHANEIEPEERREVLMAMRKAFKAAKK